ncbi:hypothetical protein AcV7_004027 [Taiwanofungus camphoratus]|nr:hypothetical protein AcV7_004027 [Antrodia cinnamomea]
MPASDSKKETEASYDSGREVDREKDREKDKSSKSKGSSKTKDLSHVPCKFFKVGSCTAGSSCPFSHAVLEPGQQKEVCAWFVKGNCKFGHKCALAHILPGQSMSMDRKNKKAAQLAANASNTGNGSSRDGSKASGRSQKAHVHGSGGSSGASSQTRNALLSGSTAPTRVNASRPPISLPLKSTLSPSTPAPPVKDTDFASFGLPDESNKLPSAPAQGKSATAQASAGVSMGVLDNAQADKTQTNESPRSHGTTSPLPTSSPSAPRRIGNSQHGSPGSFGPIGSPPRSSPSAGKPARINGFSPGTSPQGPGLSTSPFSAPGSRSLFLAPDSEESINGFKARSGLSTSLGAMMTWTSERNVAQSRQNDGINAQGIAGQIVVEDEDFEEFLPSSLTDLLTPEERSRRFSRTNGVRPSIGGFERDAGIGQRPITETSHHKYSRSVPAPSLLKDLRSIWSDSGSTGAPETGGNSGTAGVGGVGGGLGNGTPSSFQSNSGTAGMSSGEDILAPSNASAAFLPGLHQHFLNAKAQRSNVLSGASPRYPSNVSVSQNLYPNGYGIGLNGGTLSPPRTSTTGSRPSFETQPSDSFFSPTRHSSSRPIPSGTDGLAPDTDERRSAFSPSTRALQAHAPGQSLPQGLAAGYSRIHALPPPPVIPSPSTSGAFSVGQIGGFSPGTKVFSHSHSTSGDWHSMSPNAGNLLDQLSMQQNAAPQSMASMGGLEAMFSRLSYSAATTRGVGSTGVGARNPGGRNFNGQGLSSPLSGPVLTGDDDDLFSMDG